MKSIKGKFKTIFNVFSILLFGFVLLQYQNCGTSSNSGSLSLGSSGNNPTPTGVSVTINGNTNISVNTSAAYTAIVNGGTPPYNFIWEAAGSTNSCTNSAGCALSYATGGNKNIRLTVLDSKGFSANTNLTVAVNTINPPSTCSSSLGAIDLAFQSTPLTYQNADCTITVRGWGWHKDALQNTKIIITTSANTTSYETPINGIRDDVHGVHSCIPVSPQAQPGYITTVPATYPDSDVIALYLDVKNPANLNVNRIGFMTINSHSNCYVSENGCPPGGYCPDTSSGD